MEEEYPHGAAVLDTTERWLRRFVHYPSDAHYTLSALWIAGSHMTDETGTVVHKAYGRIGFVSDEPSSGKTTAMERCLALTPRGEVLVQPSLAGIMDAMDERQIIALDEADKYFGKTGRMSHVVAFLNAGYKRGGGSVRHRSRKVDSFALVMYSGLLEALGVNPDLYPLRTRSFLVGMRTLPVGKHVEEYDDEQHDGAQDMLRDALASWGRSVAHDVSSVPVQVPDGVTNRRAQLWRPLFRVALLAGAGWPDKAWQACQELESGINNEKPALTADQRIMVDVLSVCRPDEQIVTEQLIRRLHRIEDGPWRYYLPDPTSTGCARELAALMSVHGLSPKNVRWFAPELGASQGKGYDLSLHTDCHLCVSTRPHTDETESHTDETVGGTDATVAGTDETLPVRLTVAPVTSRRPAAPAVPLFIPPGFN